MLKFRCCGLSKLVWPILNSYLMVNILKFWCRRVPKLSLPIYHMVDIPTFGCRGVSKLLVLVPLGVQTVIGHLKDTFDGKIT